MMVNSWITKYFTYLNIRNHQLINSIPQLLNNRLACLDQCFIRFSTEVDEKPIRKTIFSTFC
jgi:hypothetical protein